MSIKEDIALFTGSIIAGLFMGIFFDLLRAVKKTFKLKKAIFVLDIIYWLIAVAIAYFSVFKWGDGRLRGFVFLGFICGVIIYAFLIGPPVFKCMIISLRLVLDVFRNIWTGIKWVFWPFTAIIRGILSKMTKIKEFVHYLQKNSKILVKKYLKKS